MTALCIRPVCQPTLESKIPCELTVMRHEPLRPGGAGAALFWRQLLAALLVLVIPMEAAAFFSCSGETAQGELLEITIPRAEGSAGLKAQHQGEFCSFGIQYLSLSQASVAPRLYLSLQSGDLCASSTHWLKRGYLNISLRDTSASHAHAHVLVGQHPVQCHIEYLDIEGLRGEWPSAE